MRRYPTPIADELDVLGTSLVRRAEADCPLWGAELLQTAERLGVLARHTAPLERFHAELVAEAAEEELRIACNRTSRSGFLQ